MSMSNSGSGGAISISWILFVVFLILKLTNVIDWSWWWVTSPLWISFLIVIIVLIFMYCLLGGMKK